MDKKIARDTIVTFASTGVYFAALTVTSILIVKLVGVEGRGLYAEATLLPTAICVIGWLGLPSAVAYRVASAGSTRDVTIGTARTIALVLSLILCVVSIIICAIAPLDPAVRIESILFALFIPLNLFIFLHRAIVQADLRSGDFNVIRLAAPLVYVLALVALWMVGHATVMALVVILLIANGFALVVSCVLARGGRWFAFSRTEAKALLGYGARAHLGSLGTIETVRADQIILALFLTSYDLGIYVVVMTFVLANRMIGNSIGMIAFPLTAKMGDAEQIARNKRLIAGFLILALTLSVAGVMVEVLLGRQLLDLLFDLQDPLAYSVLVIACVASIFMNVRQVASDMLRGVGRPGVATAAEVCALLVLAVCALFWREDGVLGIAWALAASSIAAVVLVLLMVILGGTSRHRRQGAQFKGVAPADSVLQDRPAAASPVVSELRITRRDTEDPARLKSTAESLNGFATQRKGVG